MENFEQRIYHHICEWKCGDEFYHPGSCEICLDDIDRDIYREFELNRARELGDEYFDG